MVVEGLCGFTGSSGVIHFNKGIALGAVAAPMVDDLSLDDAADLLKEGCQFITCSRIGKVADVESGGGDCHFFRRSGIRGPGIFALPCTGLLPWGLFLPVAGGVFWAALWRTRALGARTKQVTKPFTNALPERRFAGSAGNLLLYEAALTAPTGIIAPAVAVAVAVVAPVVAPVVATTLLMIG